MFKKSSPISREKVTIEVNCNNRARLLNALRKSGIRVFGAKITPKKQLEITINHFQCEKTFAICNNLCYTYRVCSSFGARTSVASLVKRVGFVLGTLAVVTLSVFTSNRYLSVEIYGLQNLTKSEIIESLSSGGIGVGAKKSEITRQAVIDRLLQIEGVANCEVAVKGGTLVIRITETADKTPKPPNQSQIVSDCNGRVSQIVCRSGTAKVKIGQMVKTGQTLIEGALYSTEGKIIETVVAVGEVVVETNHTFVYHATDQIYETVYTGAQTTITSFNLFGLTLFSQDSPYDNYQATTTSQTLQGIIPVTVMQTTYRQTERVLSSKTVDEWASEVTKQAEKTLIDSKEKVLASKYDTQKVGQNEYQITVVVTTERKIS